MFTLFDLNTAINFIDKISAGADGGPRSRVYAR